MVDSNVNMPGGAAGKNFDLNYYLTTYNGVINHFGGKTWFYNLVGYVIANVATGATDTDLSEALMGLDDTLKDFQNLISTQVQGIRAAS